MPSIVPIRRSRPLPLKALIILAALLVAAVDSRAARTPTGPYTILAGPHARKEPPSGGSPVARFFLKGLTVEAEFLEPAERAAFIERIAPGRPDPFAVPPGRLEVFHAFRVLFDNRSSKTVTFQAGNVLLITDRKEQQFTIDLTDMYRRAVRAEVADPERTIAQVAGLIFDSSLSIPAGARESRLLVFGPLPEKWKEFRLHFSFVQIGTDTHTISFAFHRRFLNP